MRPRNKISLVGLAVAAAAVLAVVPGAVSASANAASAPSTSPSVSHTYYSNPANIPACKSGYACAIVSYGSGYYVFNFYNYGTYSLSNWFNQGGLTNAQTGGAAVRLDDSSNDCLPAAHITFEVNWTPVNHITLTSSGC